MFRYLACLSPGSPDHLDAVHEVGARLARTSTSWHRVFTANNVHVFAADEYAGLAAQPLASARGVILGALFERATDSLSDTPARTARLDAQTSRAIVASEGMHLISHYWGNYVAILHGSTHTWVIKDPTGTLPCYVGQLGPLRILFSCLTDFMMLRGRPLHVNPHYLRDRALGRTDFTQEPLQEVSRLLPGQCLSVELRGSELDESRSLYWHPLRIAQIDNAIADPQVADALIREVVHRSTATLASAHDSALLRLSGGLDSSIIAACLAPLATRQRINTYTYYNPRSRADERPWARMVAQMHGLPHLEVAGDPRQADLAGLTRLQPTVDAVALLEYVGRSQLEQELCAQHQASAIVTGDGGDSGFGSDAIAWALVENLRRGGPNARMLKLATQISLYTHRSSWQVLITSVQRWLHRSQADEQNNLQASLPQLATASCNEVTDGKMNHPWFEQAEHTPWVVIRRLGMLPYPTSFYDLSLPPAASAPSIISPLYAQPVIELLLRIPLDVLFLNGQDRGLARYAFRNHVPAPILQRLWKDRAPGFLDEIVDRHRPFLRECLLDGVLMKSGLLDRKRLEAELSGRPSREPVYVGELLQHLDTEMWARHFVL